MTSPWTEALLRWMKRQKLNGLEVAQALSVSPSVVHYWRRGAIPRAKLLFAVERLTKGKVKAEMAAKPKKAPTTKRAA